MLLIFGTRLFGKVDQVDDVHVATKFFHVQFVPLFPLESWVVLSKDGDGWQGFPMAKLAWKSVLIAWLRAALVVGAAGTALCAFAMMNPRMTALASAIAFAPPVLLLGATVLSYRLTRGDEDTIVAFGRLAGLDEEDILRKLGRHPESMHVGGTSSPVAL